MAGHPVACNVSIPTMSVLRKLTEYEESFVVEGFVYGSIVTGVTSLENVDAHIEPFH